MEHSSVVTLENPSVHGTEPALSSHAVAYASSGFQSQGDQSTAKVQTMHSTIRRSSTFGQFNFNTSLADAHLLMASGKRKPFFVSKEQEEFVVMRHMLREMKLFNIIPQKFHLEFANLFGAQMYGVGEKLDT